MNTVPVVYNDDILVQEFGSRPFDRFQVELFTQYDEIPAPMCDGGSHHHALRIRFNRDNLTVVVSWREHEGSERKRVTLPYMEFWEIITAALEHQLER